VLDLPVYLLPKLFALLCGKIIYPELMGARRLVGILRVGEQARCGPVGIRRKGGIPQVIDGVRPESRCCGCQSGACLGADKVCGVKTCRVCGEENLLAVSRECRVEDGCVSVDDNRAGRVRGDILHLHTAGGCNLTV